MAVCERTCHRVRISHRHRKSCLQHQWHIRHVVADAGALARLDAKRREQLPQNGSFVMDALMNVFDPKFLATPQDGSGLTPGNHCALMP
jgi:hypothetical protein